MAASVVETEEDKSNTVTTYEKDDDQKKMSSNDNNAGTSLPSYESVEKCEKYVLAKKYLNEDKFELALETIEDGIRKNEAALVASNAVVDVDIAFHESMAPFHYLYGTTLLYNLEENSDWQQMTTMENVTAAAKEEEEGSNDNNDPASILKDDNQNQHQQPPVDNADEMEIAWENLEISRSIVERMLTKCPLSSSSSSSSSSDTKGNKLRMDLAQIFLREGDLQRLNGRYEDSINDYSSCLELRTLLFDHYDRKIADAHYNMAITHMLRCAEAEKTGEENSNSSEKTRTMDRNTGVYHYLACAKCLCGIIAKTCNVDPTEIVTLKEAEGNNSAAVASAEGKETMMDPKIATCKLRRLRKNVEHLKAPTGSEDDTKKVEDLIQLLSEIQETIDETENSARGVREVSEMKAAAEAAVARGETANPFQSSSNDGNVAASTTTIGFGATASSLGLEANSNPVATSGGKINNSNTPPVVMMIKKKKRSKDGSISAESQAKRMKSE